MSSQPSAASRGSSLCLLSLDSGGPRGVSQLTILAQLMHQMRLDSPDDKRNRPCDVFDMIGGVGSGGAIAILLVIFKLTAEEALDEFTDLYANLLDNDDMDAGTRTAALKQHIDRLLKKHGFGHDSRIFDSKKPYCKLAIPTSYKHHAGSICTLRNYYFHKARDLNITLSESLMATLANPPLFIPIQLIKDSTSFEYMDSEWTPVNPTEEIIAEMHDSFSAEQSVACIISLGCGHSGMLAVPEDSKTATWNEFLEKLVTDGERRAQGIDSRMGHLGFYHRFSVGLGLGKTSAATDNLLEDIAAHTRVYLDDATVSQKIVACAESLQIRDGVSSLEQLQHTGGKITPSPQLPPPISPFVMRREPWKFIKRVLPNIDLNDADRLRMLIVTGIGGCGKTQLILKFMEEYRTRFASWIFIDGSNEDQIRADILRKVRSLGAKHSQKSFEDCLLFLSQPLENNMWLLIYDNVDDPNLDLSSLLPQGASCAIIITSRNSLLGDLHPEGHLRLDIMELEEAVELLCGNSDLATTDQARIDATAITEALGCLPIALQQARAYMQHTKFSARVYLEQLSISRTNLLRYPVKFQLGSQAISTYAGFETPWLRLPESSQKLLKLLSYFHWGGFPLELATIGARNQFSKYEVTEAPHAHDFDIGKNLLEDIFLMNGEWDVTNLDTMVLSLQNYSLVSVISGIDTLLIQLHPLVHEWVKIYISGSENHGYQSAAILLLALGARKDRTAATQYLASHVTHMYPLWKQLDLNNTCAFRSILEINGAYQGAVELQELIVEKLQHYPEARLRDEKMDSNSRYLAILYHKTGRLKEAEALFGEVVKRKQEALGQSDPDTISASSDLALIYYDLGRLNDAEVLSEEVLRLRKDIYGERHTDTISASHNLAIIYGDLGKLNEAEAIFEEVLRLRKEILGENHPGITDVSHELAVIYRESGKLEEAATLLEQVLQVRKTAQGERHLHTIRASSDLAAVLRLQGKLPEAEELAAKVLQLRLELLGDKHHDTHLASYRLAAVYHDQGRFQEAEARLLSALDPMRNALGNKHHKAIAAMLLLAKVYCSLNKSDDARELLVVAGPIISETLNNSDPQYLELQQILSEIHPRSSVSEIASSSVPETPISPTAFPRLPHIERGDHADSFPTIQAALLIVPLSLALGATLYLYEH